MQTIPVNKATPDLAAHHVMPQLEPLPLPRVPSTPGVVPGIGARPAGTAHQQVEANPYAEFDAMLIRDPNIGAVHGLRTALLFNAGLVLSGLMVWELWILLAS